MAVAPAFQRNAFQNNAFQVGTLVVIGSSLGFTGYVFRRKKWEDMMEEVIERRRQEEMNT